MKDQENVNNADAYRKENQTDHKQIIKKTGIQAYLKISLWKFTNVPWKKHQHTNNPLRFLLVL